jgi:hypothetical protein
MAQMRGREEKEQCRSDRALLPALLEQAVVEEARVIYHPYIQHEARLGPFLASTGARYIFTLDYGIKVDGLLDECSWFRVSLAVQLP